MLAAAASVVKISLSSALLLNTCQRGVLESLVTTLRHFPINLHLRNEHLQWCSSPGETVSDLLFAFSSPPKLDKSLANASDDDASGIVCRSFTYVSSWQLEG